MTMRAKWRIHLAAVMATAVLIAGLAPRLRAEEVRREHLGIDLLGNVEVPAGAKLDGGRVVLIVHGTLAHHGMEIVKSLQGNLAQRGLASLAITLSLGRDARRGMFECDAQHEHRLSDAADEIGAWVDWLKQKNVGRIAVLGHSRGAQQVAHYAVTEPDAVVDRLVLVAPPLDTAGERAERYKAAFGADLAPLVASAAQLAANGEEDTLMELPGFLGCKPAKATAAAVLDYYDPDDAHHVAGLLRRISRPVLVAAGSADQVSANVAARMKAADVGAHVTVKVVDGADHFFRDLFGEDLADLVKDFAARP